MRFAPLGIAFSFLFAGCVASGVVEQHMDTSDGGTTDTTEAGATTDGSAPSFDTPDATSNEPCPTHCSTDLRALEDCHGKAVQVCGDDQGCSEGACIEACKAADAAHGTTGCEFYVAPMQFRKNDGVGPRPTCVAAIVINGNKLPASVTGTFEGADIDLGTYGRIPRTQGDAVSYDALPADGKVPAEGVAIYFLQQTAAGACPVEPVKTGPMLLGTSMGSAFRLQSSMPVNTYSVLPGMSAYTSLALLYPTASWGTSYVANIPEQTESDRVFYNMANEPVSFVVIAKEPTTVFLTPSQDLVGNADAGIRSVAAEGTRHFELEAGGVLLVEQQSDLSGSILKSDKPVAMLSAGMWHELMTRHLQLPPVTSSGHRYAAVRPRDRDPNWPERHGWRFVGAVDGTKLVYHPSAPSGAPTQLDRGTVVEFETGDRFVVESQDADHPFTLLEGTRATVSTTAIQYEALPAIGLDQLVSSQLFYTVPGYSIGHLVVVRAADASGTFHPVTLDCLGDITGWTAIDENGQYEYAYVDTPKFDFNTQKTICDLGRQTMHSDAPFGVNVWGWKNNDGDTYGYPAAVGLRTLNGVDVGVQ